MADIDTSDYVVVSNNDIPDIGESPETVDEIKGWLCPTDSDSPASEYQKHINSHVSGTGEWILETDQYRRWREADDQGALWIRGIPGSGKSVVAATFIQRLQTQEDCPVLFFFFREIILSNRTPRSLVQDFACGLLAHSPQLQSSLKTLKDRHRTIDAAPFEELWRCLSTALAATSRVYCVVDALDEMEPGHEDFSRSLIDLANRHPSSIKLVLTSRQLLYLEERFRGTSGLIDLRLDRRNVDQDIATYIEHRVSTHQPPINPEEAASIKRSICEKGRGLFLYARLMMDELLSHPKDIMSQLALLPDGLGGMYTDILREHAERSGTTLSFQRLILQWITHSARPLRLLELATAIDSLPDRGGLRPEQDVKVAVRTACGPLLELCEDGVIQIIHHSLTEFFRDPNISHVRRAEQTSGDTPVLDSAKAHAHIARTCIRYLLSDIFDVKVWHFENDAPSRTEYSIKLKEKMQQFPFLQYSVQYWHVHAAEADDFDGELLATIDSLLRHSPVKFDTWKAFYVKGNRGSLSTSSSALHVAAFFGLRKYAEQILSDMDVNITDETDQTPLGYAAMAGHADTITLLLQHGARHDSADESGMAPVHHAAYKNHPRAIRALLDGGADPLLPKSKEDVSSSWWQGSSIGRTALFYACHYGRVEVFEELWRNLSAESLRNGPLHWAADAGRSKILSALLQNPEIRLAINNNDANGNTPLYLAAYAREPEAVKVLLEYGADVNAVSGDKREPPKSSKPRPATRASATPFYLPIHGWAHLSGVRTHQGSMHTHHGSMHNMQRVVDLLVKAGCDVNSRNHEGRTALFATGRLPKSRGLFFETTEREFGLAMVSVLLAHGADATVTDIDGNTPLHLLEYTREDEELVRMLVNAGTDINAARKTDGKTFIMKLANSFSFMDLKLFQELNVDFNRQDADGNTPAHLAAFSASRSGAARWLDIANPEIRNHAGETVLHKLISGGQKEASTIQQMLDKGFSLESRDHSGRTVLLGALAGSRNQGTYDTVKLLLELGANAQATDYEGKSALHVVARCVVSYVDGCIVDIENKLKVMRLLIDAGVHVHSVDHNGNTILHDIMACEAEWYHAQPSAWAALELGVDPKRRNHQGRTILHMDATVEKYEKLRRNDGRPACDRMSFALDPQRGLDVNAPDYEGVTPLHLAASKSERNSWMLIQAGADIQSRTHKGETPLHFAARAGQANIVGFLLDLYQKTALSVDSQSLSGRTALHEAAQSGQPESVRLLLDAGADPHKVDRDGRGPLHAAAEFVETHQSFEKGNCQCGPKCYNSNCRKDLFGAEKNAFHFMGLIIQNEDGARNIREVVRLLLDAGANPAHLDRSDYTATDVALMSGSYTVVDELRATMSDVYGGPTHEKSLLPIDSLGESLCSFTGRHIPGVVEMVQVPEDSHAFLERAMSMKNAALVEELVRSKGLRLIREDGTTPLRLAARWGLTSMMEKLIPYAGNLDPCYASLMAEAAKRVLPNLDMIKLLTQNRESSDTFQSDVDEAIRTLAKGSYWWHPAALAYLLGAGADPDTRGPKDETPLHSALSAGESEVSLGELWPEQTLEVLLKYKADVNAVSSQTGLAPLATAIENKRRPAVLKLLLDHGADLSLGREPAICTAIEGSNLPATETLLQAGADPNTMLEPPKKKILSKEVGVQTILEYAACPGWQGLSPSRAKIMSLLLEYGANPNLPLENGRSTPLHEISGRNGFVKPIIQAGYDLEQRDVNGRTPLIKACNLASERWQPSLAKEHTAMELIAGGADVHAVDNDGRTALHYAAHSNLGRTVQMLLQHSASVAAKDNRGLTPLYYAFLTDGPDDSPESIDVDLINDLLDAGADPLERGPCGRTALHFLAPTLLQYNYTGSRPEGNELVGDSDVRSGDKYAECAKLYRRFVEAGCDRNARDNQGNTPVFAYVATEKWYHEDVERPCPPTREEMTAMFTDHDIFVANDAGDTLLHVVARRNDEEDYMRDAPIIFSTLAELGLDPLAENKDGQSALDIAHAWGHEEILAMYARNDE